MSRRTKDFKVEEVGRDQGKVFRLTEMDAFAAERFAAKVILALLRSGAQISESAQRSGLAGLAGVGLSAFSQISTDDLLPLLDEMMTCVQCVPDPRSPFPRSLVGEDIEEVATLFVIRRELLDLHLGFSIAAKLSNLSASAAEETTLQSTPTSAP